MSQTSVAPVSTSYGSSDQLSVCCPRIPPIYLSRRSSCVAWTTATLCGMASTMDYLSPPVSPECCSAHGHRCPCGDHITPVLRQLHWLPVSHVQDCGAHESVACCSCSRVPCCRTLIITHCGPIQMTCGSCS